MRAEEFDKQLQVVLKGRTFAYEQAAWEGMERLLDAEKKRKKAWWLWLWPAVLFAGLGGTLWFAYPAASDEIKTMSTVSENTSPSESHAYAASSQPAAEEPSKAMEADADNQGIAAQTKNLGDNGTPPPSSPEMLGTAVHFPAEPTGRQGAFTDWLQQLNRREAQLDRRELPLIFSNQPRTVTYAAGIEPKQPVDKLAFLFGPQLGGYYVPANPERASKITAMGGLFGQLEWKRLLLSVEPSIAFIRADQGSSQTADTSFAFGYTITTEQLQWNDQLEWQIPVLFGMRLGERHQLLAGPVFHQYISSAYVFERTRTVQGQGTTVLAQQSGRGQMPGRASMPSSLLFRYQYRLNDAFGLGIQYQSAPPSSNRLHWQIQLRYQLINIR